MSPHETGIEETGVSFKKGKVDTLKKQIEYTYHISEEIPEKTAFLLLEIAKKLEVLEDRLDFLDNQPAEEKPAPIEEPVPTSVETKKKEGT